MTPRKLKNLKDAGLTNRPDLSDLFVGGGFDIIVDKDEESKARRRRARATTSRGTSVRDSESDEILWDKSRKPSNKKQSELFRSPITRWFPDDGDGDPEHPESWRYVTEWDADAIPIRDMPKYTILSNVVVWMLWKSGTHSATDLAKYWPYDFATNKRRTILAGARRNRGRSKICNDRWAMLPVLKGLEIKEEPIPSNVEWGRDGYDFNRGNFYTTVWDTATSITLLPRNDTIFHPEAARMIEPGKVLALDQPISTSKLPGMDDDTLFLTWSSNPTTHPELADAFRNNKRYLHELQGLKAPDDRVWFCRNVGSDFGAADVMIAGRSPAKEIGEDVVEAVRLALMACMSRGKKKLVVGGFFTGALALPVSLGWYGGNGVCPFEVTVYRRVA